MLDVGLFKKELDKLVLKGAITKQTAMSYYYCISRIAEAKEVKEKGPQADIIKKIVVDKASTKDELIKYVSAIKKYEDIIEKKPKAILYGDAEVSLFSSYKVECNEGKEKSLRYSEETVMRKVNGLKNRRLKYALRLQLKSGLRIKEIADLTKEDITFREDKITLKVREGKGRKTRTVEVVDDKYLYDNLNEWVNQHKNGEVLFYSRNYLMKKAREIGIRTHDLRRINAQKRFNNEIREGKDRGEAKEMVKSQLGHEKISTTNIYLRYKYKNNKGG